MNVLNKEGTISSNKNKLLFCSILYVLSIYVCVCVYIYIYI